MLRLVLALTACAGLARTLPAEAASPAITSVQTAADVGGGSSLLQEVRYHHHHHHHHHHYPHA